MSMSAVQDHGFFEAADRPQPVKADFSRYALLGYLSIALVFGGFGVWAAYAPLDRAAIAPGTVSVSGDHKVVQHREGGIIREILAKETHAVHRGDLLFRLQPTEAQANTDLLRKQMDAALAEEARLLAERGNARMITFPDALLNRQNVPEAALAIADQQRLFVERRNGLISQINILNSQIAQQQQELAGRDRQRAALSAQLASFETQMNNVRPAVAAGYYPRNKFLELERERARVEGDLGQAQADVARLTQTAAQTRLQIDQTLQKYLTEVGQQLDGTRAKLSDLREKLVVAEDVLRRVDIRAERDGIVMNMKVHSVGAVVKPGDTLAEIVPVGEGVDVMAHVSPRDIESVAIGQRAEVRFSNFSSRTTPTIFGKVSSVSADAMSDEASKQSYYSARVVIDYSTIPPEIAEKILPGMQADVIISTGERTVLEYLVGPLLNTLAKTFREK
ncbi:HlyD family type I secretion periplasmic adaptor subunit [Bradyrhizobium oligotrophicum]|uniref:HlyD family type I secretion periplasmic adaptor subunit n=1 Tax=Bradyrhizobium oligotrophicum TaxID=44255 RepID=UPI003EBDF4FB